MNPLPDTFPQLRTARLTMKAITHVHVNDLFKAFSDPEVTRYYNLLPFTHIDKAAELQALFTNKFMAREGIRWGIFLLDELIGTIGINAFLRGNRCNIGYDLMPAHWRKGYMVEALQAVMKYVFKTLEVNRIEAEVMIANAGSCRVLEKAGFVQEGLLREYMFFNEQYYDMYMYALLRKDCML